MFSFSPRNHRDNARQRKAKNQNRLLRSHLRGSAKARRVVTQRNLVDGFDPPEEWHEPTGIQTYEVITRDPGKGYLHVVTQNQIRTRLSKLPRHFLEGLEVVQLSRMTRKKSFTPCYGLQWGCAIYLYPFEESLDEYYYSPPTNELLIETKMYGGRWEQPEPGVWRLIWTKSTARDFQLNNVLIHELGHLVDRWNTNYMDQERFAEWFAIEYGYRQSGGHNRRRPRRKIRRRHHGS